MWETNTKFNSKKIDINEDKNEKEVIIIRNGLRVLNLRNNEWYYLKLFFISAASVISLLEPICMDDTPQLSGALVAKRFFVYIIIECTYNTLRNFFEQSLYLIRVFGVDLLNPHSPGGSVFYDLLKSDLTVSLLSLVVISAY